MKQNVSEKRVAIQEHPISKASSSSKMPEFWEEVFISMPPLVQQHFLSGLIAAGVTETHCLVDFIDSGGPARGNEASRFERRTPFQFSLQVLVIALTSGPLIHDLLVIGWRLQGMLISHIFFTMVGNAFFFRLGNHCSHSLFQNDM